MRTGNLVRSLARTTSACTAAVIICACSAPAQAQWTQWGGPTRDFRVNGGKLNDKWPDKGPRTIWSRDLGEGYSAILVDKGTLYTMYRHGEKEAIVALSAVGGKTKWEHAYPADPFPQNKLEFGKGPNGTPLLVNGNLYAVGFTGIFTCVDAKTGKPKWTKDLVKEFDTKIQDFGYSCSPLAYKANIIVMAGGKQTGVIAFDPASGKVNWKTEPLDMSYASPIVIHVAGEDQIVFMSSTEVIGIAADGGAVRWRYPHINMIKNNCFMPIWDEKNALLFVTSHADAGSRALHIHKDGEQWKADQVWADKKTKMFHSTGTLVDGIIYGCLGDQPPTFLTAINIKDGKVLWKERGFPKANIVYCDGKMIVLDEDGQLGLLKVSLEKCEVVSKTQLLDKVSWTAPTLADGKLYVRDKKKIMALEIGKKQAKPRESEATAKDQEAGKAAPKKKSS